MVCCIKVLYEVTGAFLHFQDGEGLFFRLSIFCARAPCLLVFPYLIVYFKTGWEFLYYSGKQQKISRFLYTWILIVKDEHWLKHKLYFYLHYFSCLSVSKHGVSKTLKKDGNILEYFVAYLGVSKLRCGFYRGKLCKFIRIP